MMAEGDKEDSRGSNTVRKRRKVITNVIQCSVFTTRPEFKIHLTEKDTRALGLTNRCIISLEKLDYITFNSTQASYLFNICCSLFEVPSADINLFHNPDGTGLNDDADDWRVVEEGDNIISGDYLLTFEDIASSPIITFVLILL